MRWWIYKCNNKQLDYQHAWGDWNEFYSNPDEHWGSSQWIPALAQLKQGDMIIAYQTDRNELVGIAQVRQSCEHDSYLYLTPIETIGVKVRPLKKANPKVAAIPALQPGPIKTVYEISASDARALLKAAKDTYMFYIAPTQLDDDSIPEEKVFIEGEKRAAVTTVRNAKLRVAAKKKWGLKCYCCGFDFEQFYGQAAKGSAIVHHLQPFTTASDQQRKATIEDVRVVCANCHYILHLKNPPMGVDELKEIISQSWHPWSQNGVKRKR